MELYNYRVSSFEVQDGDTVDVTVELGFDINYRTSVRMEGIDTPEKTGKTKPVGLAVADWVRWLLATYPTVTLISKRWDKYGGRIDGQLFINAAGRQPLNVSDLLLKLHMAQPLSPDGARSCWKSAALKVALAAAAKRDLDPWLVQ
jgi:hypothetical protein